MPSNHEDGDFVRHNLKWQPGTHGKGFLIKPTDTGIHHWPYLAQAAPIVWTWPTENLKPTHSQMKVHTFSETPQGMSAAEKSYFHITPEGGVYLYGGGRALDNNDHAAISGADPRLQRADQAPEIEPDAYGHANRLLEILGGRQVGKWSELPNYWREKIFG